MDNHILEHTVQQEDTSIVGLAHSYARVNSLIERCNELIVFFDGVIKRLENEYE